jgi:hypothetical protein
VLAVSNNHTHLLSCFAVIHHLCVGDEAFRHGGDVILADRHAGLVLVSPEEGPLAYASSRYNPLTAWLTELLASFLLVLCC